MYEAVNDKMDFFLPYLQKKYYIHAWIQMGDRTPPPPPLKNHKIIGFLSNTGLKALKTTNHKASIQCWAIIGRPAKSHFTGRQMMAHL